MTIYDPRPSRAIDLTGQTFGMLTVIERGANRGHARAPIASWLVRCACGTVKEVAGTNLRHGKTRTCGCQADRSDRAEVGYQTAHLRLKRLHGRAADHRCATTGCDATARDWAYQHTAGDEERYGIPRPGCKPSPYSLNPDDYRPMCKPHHSALDRAMRSNA